jgi:transcriptional regulator GlxA family with amidase domain
MSTVYHSPKTPVKSNSGMFHDEKRSLADGLPAEGYTVSVESVTPAASHRSAWEHPAIQCTKVYLEEHYAEEVSLEELASVACLSPFHLSRIFRQSIGVSPHVYQIHIRLAHAKTLLAQGFKIGDVACATGFFDQAHFTNQFKRYLSVTPGSYRKTARFSKTIALGPVTLDPAIAL